MRKGYDCPGLSYRSGLGGGGRRFEAIEAKVLLHFWVVVLVFLTEAFHCISWANGDDTETAACEECCREPGNTIR